MIYLKDLLSLLEIRFFDSGEVLEGDGCNGECCGIRPYFLTISESAILEFLFFCFRLVFFLEADDKSLISGDIEQSFSVSCFL